MADNSEDDMGDGDITTLMVCNLPPRLGVEKFLEEIDKQGFAKTYDLIYKPKSTRPYRGVVFINFIMPELATAFAKVFGDFAFPEAKWGKAYTQPAHRQGYAAQLMYNNRLGSGDAGTLLTFRSEVYTSDGLPLISL